MIYSKLAEQKFIIKNNSASKKKMKSSMIALVAATATATNI